MIFETEPKIERVEAKLKSVLSDEPLVAIYALDEKNNRYAVRILVNLPELEDATTLPKVYVYNDLEKTLTTAGELMARDIVISYPQEKEITQYALFNIGLEYTLEETEEAQAIHVYVDNGANPRTNRGTVTTVMRPTVPKL